MKQFIITLALLASFPAMALDDLVGTTTGPIGEQGQICDTVKRDVADDFANRTGARPGGVSECNCRDMSVTACAARACTNAGNCTQPSREEHGLNPAGLSPSLVGTTRGPAGDQGGICAQVKRDVQTDLQNHGHQPVAVSECNCWTDTVHACSARACSAEGECPIPEV